MLNPRPCGEEKETTAAVNLIYIPPDNSVHAVHSINCIILNNFNAEILNLIKHYKWKNCGNVLQYWIKIRLKYSCPVDRQYMEAWNADLMSYLINIFVWRGYFWKQAIDFSIDVASSSQFVGKIRY